MLQCNIERAARLAMGGTRAEENAMTKMPEQPVGLSKDAVEAAAHAMKGGKRK